MIGKLAKLAFTICLTLFFTHHCNGQFQTRIQLDANKGIDGRAALDEYFDGIQTRSQARLAIVIEKVRVECQLDDDQVQELTETLDLISEKIVYSEKMDQLITLRRHQQRVGFVLDENGDVIQGEVKNQTRKQAEIGIKTISEIAIEKSEVVQRTISDSLTPAQNEKWDAFVTKQADSMRTSAVDLFISRMDLLLILNDEQRTQLREAFLNDEFADALADDSRFAELNRTHTVARVGNRQEEKYTHLVSDILEEGQLKEWKRVFERELAALKKPKGLGTKAPVYQK